jgi:hypothetical protein
MGCTKAQAISWWSQPWGPGFNAKAVPVGLQVNKTAVEQFIFIKEFGFPLSVSLLQCSTLIRLSPQLDDLSN